MNESTPRKPITISLMISTYNKPDYLELSVRSAFAQTRLPDEIIIADDGSTQETADLVKRLQAESPVPVIHVWHEDKGFRLAHIRNRAIAKASGDYILQIDGDIILDPHFVADHEKFARRGSFVAGGRQKIDEPLSRDLVAMKSRPSGEILPLLPKSQKTLRLPALMPLMQNFRGSGVKFVRGCHMAYWRDDVMAVNGYNEDIVDWGCEDTELAYRFNNYGLKKRFIMFGGVIYHLYHPEVSRSGWERNVAITRRAQSTPITRIANGIKKG